MKNSTKDQSQTTSHAKGSEVRNTTAYDRGAKVAGQPDFPMRGLDDKTTGNLQHRAGPGEKSG